MYSDAASSSSEEDIPQGGCPFMSGSEKKKNPDIYQYSTGFDETFVSKFSYYLSANKIDFSELKQKKQSIPLTKSREIFNKFPIYLQHSLFFQSEDYRQVREDECCSRFMPYDTLR